MPGAYKTGNTMSAKIIPGHFTASAVVIHHEHILLIHHKRIGAWLPPGGHLEDGELPHQAALREVQEECGLTCRLISAPVPDTGDPESFILPAPLCMHRVLAVEKGEPVVHFDLAYLCRPEGVDLPDLVPNDEVHGVCWQPVSRLSDKPLAKNVIEVVGMARERLAAYTAISGL